MDTELGRLDSGQAGTATTRPRLLVLSTKSPFPPRQGDEVRLVGLLRAAAAIGDTTLAIWGEGGPSGDEEVTVHSFPMSKLAAILGVIGQGVRGHPLVVGPYIRGFPQVAGQWDLVIGIQLKTWRWAQTVPAKIHALDMVDSLSRYALSPQLPLVKKLQLFGVATEEQRALVGFDQVWISTVADREHLLTAKDAKIAVVPNGPLIVKPLPRRGPGKNLLFVGNVVYPPNRQGIEWFLKDVWPRLHPDGFSLDLVGRGSAALGQVSGVSARGVVPELEPFYANADLVISPVGWGGGSQIKIWEALGYGRSVVVTPAGGASFDQRPEILIADGVEQWVAAIRQAVGSNTETTGDVSPIREIMGRAIESVLKRAGG